jgi:hypothetical protein
MQKLQRRNDNNCVGRLNCWRMTQQPQHISIYDPASAPATQALLREIGAAPNRTMGQNFLISGAVLDRIVATCGSFRAGQRFGSWARDWVP